MEKCYECSYNANLIYCKDCEYGLCLNCNKEKHFEGKSETHTHEFYLICDECEKLPREIYCENCEQSICQDCDKKIHKKGTRALHKRKPISLKHEKYKIILNLILYSDTRPSPENDSENGGEDDSSPQPENFMQLTKLLGHFKRNLANQLKHTIIYCKDKSSLEQTLKIPPEMRVIEYDQ